MRPRRWSGVLAIVGMISVLTGCAADGSTAGTPQIVAPPSGATNTATALQDTYATVDGGVIDLTAYAGRSVLFWFWAPY